jgi:hypothetical protein
MNSDVYRSGISVIPTAFLGIGVGNWLRVLAGWCGSRCQGSCWPMEYHDCDSSDGDKCDQEPEAGTTTSIRRETLGLARLDRRLDGGDNGDSDGRAKLQCAVQAGTDDSGNLGRCSAENGNATRAVRHAA